MRDASFYDDTWLHREFEHCTKLRECNAGCGMARLHKRIVPNESYIPLQKCALLIAHCAL